MSTRPAETALRLAAAFAFAVAAAAPAPARAGLFDDEEARRRIDALREELSQQGKDNEARIAKLEERIRNIGVVELVQQIEQLNQEIAKLRGRIEVLDNENQQIRKRERDFYLDLDSRLKRLEKPPTGAPPAAATPPAFGPGAGGPAAGSPAAGGPAVGGPAVGGPAAGGPGAGAPSVKPGFGPSAPGTAANPPTHEDRTREMKAYDAASNLFRRNDFSAAVDAFRAFLKDYPDSQLAPNATYWIGISYANLKDYPRALAAQQQLLAKHPQSSKAPDALLAVAAIEADRGDSAGARNTLEDIIARFPASEAAGKARTRLAALRH